MRQLLNNNQKLCCWSKFLCVKNYFIKKRFLATILQIDKVRRSLDGLYVLYKASELVEEIVATAFIKLKTEIYEDKVQKEERVKLPFLF